LIIVTIENSEVATYRCP